MRHASAMELRAELRQATAEPSVLPLEPQSLPSAAHFLTQNMQTPKPVGPSAPSSQSEPAASTVRERPHSEVPSRPLHPSVSQSARAFNPVDAGRQPRLSDSYTVVAAHASTGSGATTKRTVGLVVCMMVVCAATVAYLLTNASGSRAPAPGTEAQAAGSLARQDAATAQQALGDAAPVPLDSSRSASASNEATQTATARTLSATQSSTSQVVVEEADTQRQSGMSARSAGQSSESVKESMGGTSPAGREGLVIQNPVPATNPAEESRRAEAARREREQQQQLAPRPEYREGPPPGAPFPPPPDGRRPPPPDARRPPPDFRPPHR